MVDSKVAGERNPRIEEMSTSRNFRNLNVPETVASDNTVFAEEDSTRLLSCSMFPECEPQPSLVLEMPRGRAGACTAQEKHRASQGCSCIAEYCPQAPGLTRSVASDNPDILACTIGILGETSSELLCSVANDNADILACTFWHTEGNVPLS